MSCENPVILSNNSGVSNLILNGVNGFVYPEGDLESLFKTMERFFEQKLRKQMASNSRCLLKNFDWDDISDRFEKLYGETNY
jgi:Glycosyltransferase